MKTSTPLLAAAAIFATAASLHAADVSGRRMVWAHYVPWYLPGDASLLSYWFHSFPQDQVGDNPLREEIGRAMAMGIDGFFNDVFIHENGGTSYWDLRPFLKAAEGTPFLFGLCLDGTSSAELQTRELIRMLSLFGDHPNYPKMDGRYVVCTYRFRSRTPDEWRTIRQNCVEAGFPLYLVANFMTGFGVVNPRALASYAGTFERAYDFAQYGMDRAQRKSLEQETAASAAFCREHGAIYMPCVWPGYFGAWMKGGNCFYQPFCGFDTAQRRFDTWRLVPDADWLHLTTWNDHGETAMMPRRLVTGNRAVIKAMANEFKGVPPPDGNDIAFAYLREVIPGTMLRFEAMRLPTASRADVSVSGRLRDAGGNVVCELPEKAFDTNRWPRVEWLVSTTHMAESPYLVPEFTIRHFAQPQTGEPPVPPEGGPGFVRAAAGEPPTPRQIRAPKIFFAAGWLSDPVTVKVSEDDCANVDSSLSVAYSNGLLNAHCTFAAEKPARRIVLYRNDRPVTSFRPSSGKTLNLIFTGYGTIELKASGGARIVQAVKRYEKKGTRDFSWTTNRVLSLRTPGWSILSACVEAEAGDVLAFSSGGNTTRFTPIELLASARYAPPTRRTSPGTMAGDDVVPQGARIWLDWEGTAYDLPPLDMKSGSLSAEVWMTPPNANDAWWAEFEFADGSFAESAVVYPFAKTRASVVMNVVETPVTLDHPSGAAGAPDSKVLLTPEPDWPVRETKVVGAKVSPLAIRRARFDFQGEPMRCPMLPHRCWPMGPFRLVCHFTRLAEDGGGDGRIVGVDGWNEGPELRLLEDGRVEAAYCGGNKRGTGNWNDLGTPLFRHAVRSLRPLEAGRKVEIAVESDGLSLSISIDGEPQGTAALPPIRCYGNLTPALGAGINGENPTTGLLHDLEIEGSPAMP